MTGTELRNMRQRAGLAGHLICKKAGIGRSRLSDIERGYAHPSAVEVTLLERALDELIKAKEKMIAVAAECGWPTSAL